MTKNFLFIIKLLAPIGLIIYAIKLWIFTESVSENEQILIGVLLFAIGIFRIFCFVMDLIFESLNEKFNEI